MVLKLNQKDSISFVEISNFIFDKINNDFLIVNDKVTNLGLETDDEVEIIIDGKVEFKYKKD